MNIVLIGVQGSGKGTLVENLKSKLDFTLVSVGEQLRAEVKTGSALGKHIKEVQQSGKLVENETVLAVIDKLLKQNTKPNVIFDGFPRDISQVNALDKMLKVDLAISLNLSRQQATERLLGRLTCFSCGAVYNKKLVKSDICVNCGGKLVTRFDDNLQSINKRIENFYLQTQPIIEQYKKRNILFEVDATKTPDEIVALVMRKINEHNN